MLGSDFAKITIVLDLFSRTEDLLGLSKLVFIILYCVLKFESEFLNQHEQLMRILAACNVIKLLAQGSSVLLYSNVPLKLSSMKNKFKFRIQGERSLRP